MKFKYIKISLLLVLMMFLITSCAVKPTDSVASTSVHKSVSQKESAPKLETPPEKKRDKGLDAPSKITPNKMDPPKVEASKKSNLVAKETTTKKVVKKQEAKVVVKTPEKKVENKVSITIVGHAEVGTILAPYEVEILDGETVFDVLKKVTKEKEILLEFKGSGGMSYVEGISNLYEFDHGPGSGWMFSVNGEFPSMSAGKISLAPGDVIQWLYTQDMGKDIGASGKGI